MLVPTLLSNGEPWKGRYKEPEPALRQSARQRSILSTFVINLDMFNNYMSLFSVLLSNPKSEVMFSKLK